MKDSFLTSHESYYGLKKGEVDNCNYTTDSNQQNRFNGTYQKVDSALELFTVEVSEFSQNI